MKKTSIILILLLTCSCSGGGGVMDQKSSKQGDNTIDIIGLVALIGFAAYRLGYFDKIKNTPKKFHTTLIIERNNDIKKELEAASYVIFTNNTVGLNHDRHRTFCETLLDKFNPVENQETYKNNKFKVNPIILPVKDLSVIFKNDCKFLLNNYDYHYTEKIKLNYPLPDEKGPFLVAFNGRIEHLNQKNSVIGIYWNFSDLDNNEFSEGIENWQKIMSTDPSNWIELVELLSEKATIKRTLRIFD